MVACCSLALLFGPSLPKLVRLLADSSSQLRNHLQYTIPHMSIDDAWNEYQQGSGDFGFLIALDCMVTHLGADGPNEG
jgi:hypothetical protein